MQSALNEILSLCERVGLYISPQYQKKFVELYDEKKAEGYDYTLAAASFLIFVEDFLTDGNIRIYDFQRWFIFSENYQGNIRSQATVRLYQREHETFEIAEGVGPIRALYQAYTKAIIKLYPDLKDFRLKDYRLDLVNPEAETAAKVKLIVSWTNGKEEWSTIGVHENQNQAAWAAMEDCIIYRLIKEGLYPV